MKTINPITEEHMWEFNKKRNLLRKLNEERIVLKRWNAYKKRGSLKRWNDDHLKRIKLNEGKKHLLKRLDVESLEKKPLQLLKKLMKEIKEIKKQEARVNG